MKKSKLATILLCWFFGTFGVHRFYVGKIWTGLIYLFTAGLCGFGTVFDMILLLFNAFKDKEGNHLRNDIPTTIIIIGCIIWAAVVCGVGIFTGIFEGLATLLLI